MRDLVPQPQPVGWQAIHGLGFFVLYGTDSFAADTNAQSEYLLRVSGFLAHPLQLFAAHLFSSGHGVTSWSDFFSIWLIMHQQVN